MNIKEIIAKKRDRNKLNKEEINYFIENYTNGNITDYQAAALVMAIYINGMDEEEITNLTIAMANSGEILDLSSLGKIVVDKHSTGGVGDKVSIILLPIIAALGVPLLVKLSLLSLASSPYSNPINLTIPFSSDSDIITTFLLSLASCSVL